MKRTEFVIITGASGTGKTTALKTLEDIGYYAVDNLPVDLLHSFAHLVETGHPDISRAAMVMDIREPDLQSRFPAVIESLREFGYRVVVVCLETSMEALQKRFSETRRVHPLASASPLSEALQIEHELIKPLSEAADIHLDTTDLNPHELKKLIRRRFGGTDKDGRMVLSFVSFGYKLGLPREADLVFDVRFLPNPFFVEDLRDRDGRDPEVRRFLEMSAGTEEFLQKLENFLTDLIPKYAGEARGYLTVAIGCTGGRHRSVAVVERVAGKFSNDKLVNVQVRHRDLREG
ncbi:glmZ(sRNA)-inactivating NTPase [bacterium BMS3Abin14]|nr:glmZ(sRNA)-inactivating NTPase [bacterium BMS3Abin14]